VAASYGSVRNTQVQIVPFQPGLAEAFARLNLEWIERDFEVEEPDRLVLSDCENAIVSRGGQIFFAIIDGEVVGTCAIVRQTANSYELAKMAVTPAAQGRGAGRLLAEAAIVFAETAGATRVTLLTNARLLPALRLYEKLGFEHREMPADTEYARADVYMELRLPWKAAAEQHARR
jgi:GNAT superfamily N-acetyltransferase